MKEEPLLSSAKRSVDCIRLNKALNELQVIFKR